MQERLDTKGTKEEHKGHEKMNFGDLCGKLCVLCVSNAFSQICKMKQRTAIIVLLISVMACAPNQRIINSTAETQAPVNAAPVLTSFESDLQAMRNADFKFILVFRRKDGAVLTAEDKAFAIANTPYDVNRRRLADEGKAIMIGTNFQFLPGVIEKLTERFTMENYSKSDAGPMVANAIPSNTNSTPVR